MRTLLYYCVFTYIAGAFFMYKRLRDVGMLEVRDIFLLIVAPVCITPILLMPILSIFVDLNFIVFKKKTDNNNKNL